MKTAQVRTVETEKFDCPYCFATCETAGNEGFESRVIKCFECEKPVLLERSVQG